MTIVSAMLKYGVMYWVNTLKNMTSAPAYRAGPHSAGSPVDSERSARSSNRLVAHSLGDKRLPHFRHRSTPITHCAAGTTASTTSEATCAATHRLISLQSGFMIACQQRGAISQARSSAMRTVATVTGRVWPAAIILCGLAGSRTLDWSHRRVVSGRLSYSGGSVKVESIW